MNVVEYIKFNSDSGMYIAPRYAVMDAGISSTLATSYVWVKCLSLGISTQQDYIDYKASVESGMADKSKLSGILGEYFVVKLTDVSTYSRLASLNADFGFSSPWPIG